MRIFIGAIFILFLLTWFCCTGNDESDEQYADLNNDDDASSNIPDDTTDDDDVADDDDFESHDYDLTGSCPAGMTKVPGGKVTVLYEGERWGGADSKSVKIDTFCVDKYEASQPDADLGDQGSWIGEGEVPEAKSVKGVMPWSGISHTDAAAACEKAGKRLLTLAQWQMAFSGPFARLWPWGDTWDWANTCGTNQMEFGKYPTGLCCYKLCPGGFCYRVCDMVGSVAEWVSNYWDEECYGQEQVMIAGGSTNIFNTQLNQQAEDPESPGCWLFQEYALHRAGVHHHNRTDIFSDDGFRCATDPQEL